MLYDKIRLSITPLFGPPVCGKPVLAISQHTPLVFNSTVFSGCIGYRVNLGATKTPMETLPVPAGTAVVSITELGTVTAAG